MNKNDNASSLKKTLKKHSGKKKTVSLTKKPVAVKTAVKYLRISPRKLRLIAEAVKVLPPQEALTRLKFLHKKGSLIMIKGIKTVIADAKHNFDLDEKSLVFKKITVDEGPRLKRMDKSHGSRFNSGLIRKRMSHLFIEVEGV